MRKIILIGSEGSLGKFYSKNLIKFCKILVLADIKIRKNSKKGKVIRQKLDIENEEEVKNFFKILSLKYGKFDILINNAGLTADGIRIFKKKNYNKEDFDSRIWDKTNNINLKGSFLSCKYFIQFHLSKKINQKIINTGSIYGSLSPHHEIYKNQNFFTSLAYTASKSGLIGLTKWIAAKYAKDKVTCNMLSPSGVFNNQNKIFLKEYAKLLPIGRMATKSEIYGLLKFLVSADSNYVNGQDILIDGGFSTW
jgi:NAD(P)-dependent dehydrogenase (short-subunit alcohol dehydrogenase family)